MILDLHTHSIRSDDGRAKVENYCRWIRQKELPIDGFVLTEHRQFDTESDYRSLEHEYGLVILKGSEVETDYGHVLVYGVNDDLLNAFDFARIDNMIGDVLDAVNRCGAVAAPAHPGRKNVGFFDHAERKGLAEGIDVIEVCNGGSRPGEDERSAAEAARLGYRGIGGSDSHIVSRIGSCGTDFTDPVHDTDGLVAALRLGRYEARRFG